MEQLLSSVIEVHVDDKQEAYSTFNTLDCNKELLKKYQGIPRDLLLAMIVELRRSSERVSEILGATEEEIEEFEDERLKFDNTMNDNISGSISDFLDEV